MTVTVKQFTATQQVANSATTYYTAPALTTARIDYATACNTTGGAVTLTVHNIASGGSAATGNKVIDALSIGANTTVSLPLTNLVIPAGGFIQALASAATSINLTISGREIVA